MGKRVLLVEDEVDILNLLALWFEDDERCDSVACAVDMPEAIAAVGESRPDCIVIDFRLGAERCTDQLPELRSQAPAARIIVHTANHAEAHAAGALQRGADFVVEKSTISIDALVEAVLADDEEDRLAAL